MSDKRSREIRKYCLIWTLITAVFISAYSTGLYWLYKTGINAVKEELILLINPSVHSYRNRNDKLSHVLSKLDIGNYYYFGKIEDDGCLTDVYKTDYDVFFLNCRNDVVFSKPFSDEETLNYFLKNDIGKHNKVESSYKAKGDESNIYDHEKHYLTCPEDIFEKLKGAQKSGIYTARFNAFNQADFFCGNDVYTYSDESADVRFRAYEKAVFVITDFLTDNADVYEDTYYEGAYIRRADVDVEAGKILSGELLLNGDSYVFPDDNPTDTAFIAKRLFEKFFFMADNPNDSNTIIEVALHNRPDSILDNNKDLLRDNFDRSYLESLKYESISDLYKEMSLPSLGNKSGLDGFTYDLKFEDGQAVVSGICKYKDGYYRYVYIRPYAGFFEAFAPCILEVMLKVWIPGLIVAALLGAAVSRKRY